ncbi:MAG: hypothetical protein WD492_14150 [Alkalispirochaeta sp.]
MDDPVCEAILFADKVIQEKSGKYGLIGIFDRFTLPSFPSPLIPQWWVFIAIRTIEVGKHEFALTLIREEAQQVIVPINGEIEIADKSKGITLSLPIQPVSFPKPGKYLVMFYLDGTFVTHKDLTVESVSQ